MVLQDESDAFVHSQKKLGERFKRLQQAILGGEWAEVHRLFSKVEASSLKPNKLLYCVYRQQYFELIEGQEFQKALNFLNKYLKTFDDEFLSQHELNEFSDLCYLLTCRSVTECTRFKSWGGIAKSREALAEQFKSLASFQHYFSEEHGMAIPILSLILGIQDIPSGRLEHLLQQAIAFQIASSGTGHAFHPKIESYLAYTIPNQLAHSISGHKGNVKCVEWVNQEGTILASGSGDKTVKLWSVHHSTPAKCTNTLVGHLSRIWDIGVSNSGTLLASASADGCVRLWKVSASMPEIVHSSAVFSAHHSDVYSVSMHPGESNFASAGYDKIVRYVDIESGKTVHSFSGHESSVSSVVVSPSGNLIMSASKDCSVKFWDLSSGMCVKTLSEDLGEVSSLSCNASGSRFLTSSKDNSNRLWDIRSSAPLKTYRGHQNSFQNFIGCDFGPCETIVMSGSEDGKVFLWDTESEQPIPSSMNHRSVVYQAKWNPTSALIASCCQDGMIKVWKTEQKA